LLTANESIPGCLDDTEVFHYIGHDWLEELDGEVVKRHAKVVVDPLGGLVCMQFRGSVYRGKVLGGGSEDLRSTLKGRRWFLYTDEGSGAAFASRL
jgi:hypothetical protein